jgi:hypothetical protein
MTTRIHDANDELRRRFDPGHPEPRHYTVNVYGLAVEGVSYSLGWGFAPGESAKLANLTRHQRHQVELRMRRAWEGIR